MHVVEIHTEPEVTVTMTLEDALLVTSLVGGTGGTAGHELLTALKNALHEVGYDTTPAENYVGGMALNASKLLNMVNRPR